MFWTLDGKAFAAEKISSCMMVDLVHLLIVVFGMHFVGEFARDYLHCCDYIRTYVAPSHLIEKNLIHCKS